MPEAKQDKIDKESTVKIIRGHSANEVWFEVSFHTEYYSNLRINKYISRSLFRNSDILNIHTEVQGDSHAKQPYLIVTTAKRNYTFNMEVGQKFLEGFRMVNCIAAIENDI